MALRHFWFSVRISDLMSCNACQEQHLLERCLSDGQKCAGTNTDSMHMGGYSGPEQPRNNFSGTLCLSCAERDSEKKQKNTGDVKVDASGQPQFSPVRPQFISGESSGLSKVLRQSSPTRPLITCRWASLMPVYISAAQFMTKVSKALIILPGDRTNKINFPSSLRVFKCVL